MGEFGALHIWFTNQAFAIIMYGGIDQWDVAKVTTMRAGSKLIRIVENDLT